MRTGLAVIPVLFGCSGSFADEGYQFELAQGDHELLIKSIYPAVDVSFSPQPRSSAPFAVGKTSLGDDAVSAEVFWLRYKFTIAVDLGPKVIGESGRLSGLRMEKTPRARTKWELLEEIQAP